MASSESRQSSEDGEITSNLKAGTDRKFTHSFPWRVCFCEQDDSSRHVISHDFSCFQNFFFSQKSLCLFHRSPVCCATHVKEPRTLIVKEKWLAPVFLDSRLEHPAG